MAGAPGPAFDFTSIFSRMRFSVVVYRVESEDPWRATPVAGYGGLGWEEADGLHARLVEDYEAGGFTCYERAAATHVLCVKLYYDDSNGEPVPVKADKFLVALEPEEPGDGEAGEGV